MLIILWSVVQVHHDPPNKQALAIISRVLFYLIGNREAVKAKLLSLGVDSIQVQARVDALTQSEAQNLAHQLDQLPAAGTDAITIFLVILLPLIPLTRILYNSAHWPIANTVF